MLSKSDLDRAEILELVAKGELSPGHAELRAKNSGLPPFSAGPSSTVLQPQYVDKCTLAMAAAWFIWRNWEAVFHQTEVARRHWKVWDPIPKKKDFRASSRKADKADLFGETPYRVVAIGPARLGRVFYEARWDPNVERWARYSRQRIKAMPSDPDNDLPFRRFKSALQTGRLSVINTEGRQGEGAVETVDYWTQYLDRYAFPTSGHRPFVQEDAYYIPMHEVIKAEKEISRSEIDGPMLTLQQAIGWAAYQKHSKFRSLSQDDVKGKGYYDQIYNSDFQFFRPDLRLFEALIDRRLTCFNRGIEVTRAELMNLRSIWEVPDIQFTRTDLLTLWPDSETVAALPAVVSSPDHFPDFIEQPLGGSASPILKRGPKTKKRDAVIARMSEALRSKEITLKELEALTGKERNARYGIDAPSSKPFSATTIGDALKEVLAKFRN